MRIYLSGKITNDEKCVEKFSEAENRLKKLGYEVINPTKINTILPESITWKQYMQVSEVFLTFCDAIYQLKGWEYSSGANIEYLWAKEMGLKILNDITISN